MRQRANLADSEAIRIMQTLFDCFFDVLTPANVV